MERELGITNAREKFSNIIEQVQYQGDTIIINRHGKAAAAIVPVEVYVKWKKQRKALYDLFRQTHLLANLTPEEADRLALEAVVAVRSESS